MDQLITGEIIKAIAEGNIAKFFAYGLIFFFIWREVRSLKQEVKTLNSTIAESFAKGETRFKGLENKDIEVEHRLTVVEEKLKVTRNDAPNLTGRVLI